MSTTIHRDLVEKHPLFVEFDKLAGFEDVSSADVDELKAMVLKVAKTIGPHLDRIQVTFPQYTGHDIQHLLNIADHIHDFLPRLKPKKKEIIGLNGVELTFLWLAILLHDVGMFVSQAEEKQALLDSEDYKQFLRENRERADAIRQADQTGQMVTARAMEDALFADFIRRRHAERVHDYIRTHLKDELQFREIDLSREVGNLCESHNWGVGESRDSRRAEKCVERLDRKDFVGKTRVNLAYLACCLRLGDILDFDRSRTPLSAFHSIHFTESISVQEWNKHLSIKGIDVSEHRAHYVAKCKTPADYVAVNHFLDWVDRELQECTRLVREFPAEDVDRYRLNLAPVVERHQIQMENPHYVAGGFRFQLEYDQIMRLLMDKSLYPDETMFLRELLQNALDACRYQKARAEEAEMADKYIPRIQVWDGTDLPRDPSKPNEGPRIIFADNGVGMSLDQVEKFFMRVGKSYYRSAEFRAERERFAAKGIHLDACSQFGIGFLSCFLGGDRIEVETYRYGSEPLKIMIEGPSKYFVVERLTVPADAAVQFNSPSDLEQDAPPRCCGTRITVHLRDGWHKADAVSQNQFNSETDPEATSDAGIVLQTLDSFSVNQEFPITVVLLRDGSMRELPARRWDRFVPGFCGWLYLPKGNALESALVPSVFDFADFNDSLRGRGAIWFLSDAGQITLKKGFLELDWEFGGKIIENDLISRARYLINSNPIPRAREEFITALRVVTSTVSGEAKRDAFEQLASDLPGLDLIRIPSEDLNWLAGVVDSCTPRRNGDWYTFEDEIDAVCSGDGERLSAIWHKHGVARQRDLSMEAAYRFALFGIDSPGRFQTWDVVRGITETNQWIPDGLVACIDAYGNLAPQPAASRLFVPWERSERVRGAVTRAFILHADRLRTDHGETPVWVEWFYSFVSAWGASELGLACKYPEVKHIVVRELKSNPDNDGFAAALSAAHSAFGGLVFTRDLNGRYPYLDPRERVPRRHIDAAARKAVVKPSEIDQTIRSLSDFVGWDITKGLGQ